MAGERVTFIDFTPGSVTTPIWTLPGGEVPSVPGERQIEYTFENSGTYEISMRVCWIEESNNCRLRTRTVRVGSPSAAPVAGFEIGGGILDQATALRGDVVVFSDTSSGADIGQPVWTINGETFSGSEVERVFNRVGEFDVVLTIDNGVGSDSITRRMMVVDPTPPAAAFGVAANPVEAGETVGFVDESTGLIDSVQWDFGDGNTSTDATPRHSYARPGDFVATLTITNQWGSDTTSRTIQVVEPLPRPEPVIEAIDPFGGQGELRRPIVITTGQVIGLSDTSDNDGQTEWRWEFGDGNSDGGRQASHFYTEAGTYEIALTATNPSGSTITKLTITVK